MERTSALGEMYRRERNSIQQEDEKSRGELGEYLLQRIVMKSMGVHLLMVQRKEPTPTNEMYSQPSER